MPRRALAWSAQSPVGMNSSATGRQARFACQQLEAIHLRQVQLGQDESAGTDNAPAFSPSPQRTSRASPTHAEDQVAKQVATPRGPGRQSGMTGAFRGTHGVPLRTWRTSRDTRHDKRVLTARGHGYDGRTVRLWDLS